MVASLGTVPCREVPPYRAMLISPLFAGCRRRGTRLRATYLARANVSQPSKPRPELRIPSAAAQTRTVSVGKFWPSQWELSQYLKYMARTRIPEFESSHPSHGVSLSSSFESLRLPTSPYMAIARQRTKSGRREIDRIWRLASPKPNLRARTPAEILPKGPSCVSPPPQLKRE
jgi:hypothetical protein